MTDTTSPRPLRGRSLGPDATAPVAGGPRAAGGPRTTASRSRPARGSDDTGGRPRSAFPAVPPTSEVEWTRLVAAAPELPLSSRPVVVLAPHPDDESLAVGGLIAELRAREVAVEVLAVTDGEASHPGLGNLDARRAEEQRRALLTLGVAGPAVRLGLPDGDVARHADAVAAALEERCGPETVILAPWLQDGHPDHDACGRVSVEVARRVGAAVWAYPVWAWRWAAPAELRPLTLRRVTLGPEAQTAKAAAIGCHQTQTTHLDGDPILDDDVLVHFQRPWEAIIDVRDLVDA